MVLEGYVLCLNMSCRTHAATLSRKLDKEEARLAQVSVCILLRSHIPEQRMFLLSVVLAIVVRPRLLLHEYLSYVSHCMDPLAGVSAV
jgi:hypothetical protein